MGQRLEFFCDECGETVDEENKLNDAWRTTVLGTQIKLTPQPTVKGGKMCYTCLRKKAIEAAKGLISWFEQNEI